MVTKKGKDAPHKKRGSFANFILSLDTLGTRAQLNVDGEGQHQTYIGSALSCFMVFFLIVYSTIRMYDLIHFRLTAHTDKEEFLPTADIYTG